MKASRWFLTTLAAALLAVAIPAAEDGVPLAGKTLPRFREVAGTQFRLQGTAVLKAALFFDVYAAALYLGPDVPPARAMDNVPRRLEIHYLHETPKSRMIRTAEETLTRNLTPTQFAAVRDRVAALHAAYQDGSRGGCAALTYIPGRGTEFALNDQPRILIEGADFAEAYFSVWLGPRPSSQSVKEQLLQGAARPGKDSP